jgi:hypothetical protein
MATSSGVAKAAFGAALVAALVAALGPTYSTCQAVDGATRCGSATGLSVNGPWILIVVSVPVVLTLIPVLVHRRAARIVSAALLWIGCLLGMLSVGIFFLPAAILLTIAAAKRDDPVVPSSVG